MSQPSFDPKKGVLQNFESWEQVYRMLAPEELPWNAGGPDSDLVRFVDSGKIRAGAALDFGAGPGHDAIFLAGKGYKVTAIDISPKAIELARANAQKAGLESSIQFLAADLLKAPLDGGAYQLIVDRGCFHAFPPELRGAYVELAVRLLAPGGHLFLRVFSDKEPPAPGPHRFSRAQLEVNFSDKFEFVEFGEGVFAGPRRPLAYFCLLKKKGP